MALACSARSDWSFDPGVLERFARRRAAGALRRTDRVHRYRSVEPEPVERWRTTLAGPVGRRGVRAGSSASATNILGEMGYDAPELLAGSTRRRKGRCAAAVDVVDVVTSATQRQREPRSSASRVAAAGQQRLHAGGERWSGCGPRVNDGVTARPTERLDTARHVGSEPTTDAEELGRRRVVARRRRLGEAARARRLGARSHAVRDARPLRLRRASAAPRALHADTWVSATCAITSRGRSPTASSTSRSARTRSRTSAIRSGSATSSSASRARGYIEVPDRREEQYFGVHGASAGWSHHRWLVDVRAEAHRASSASRGFIHAPAGTPVPAARPGARSRAEERVQTLWWQVGFEVVERLLWSGRRRATTLPRSCLRIFGGLARGMQRSRPAPPQRSSPCAQRRARGPGAVGARLPHDADDVNRAGRGRPSIRPRPHARRFRGTSAIKLTASPADPSPATLTARAPPVGGSSRATIRHRDARGQPAMRTGESTAAASPATAGRMPRVRSFRNHRRYRNACPQLRDLRRVREEAVARAFA